MRKISLPNLKKVIALGLSLTLLCSTLTACMDKEVNQTNISLTVYDTVDNQIPEKVIAEYNKLYPDVELKVKSCENYDEIDAYEKKCKLILWLEKVQI